MLIFAYLRMVQTKATRCLDALHGEVPHLKPCYWFVSKIGCPKISWLLQESLFSYISIKMAKSHRHPPFSHTHTHSNIISYIYSITYIHPIIPHDTQLPHVTPEPQMSHILLIAHEYPLGKCDLTGMMVSSGNYPKIALFILFQVSEF